MLNGSCLCGKIQFEVSGTAKQMNFCHCKMCQKFSGSGFGSFTRVLSEEYKLVSGKDFEKIYESSQDANRAFCSNCGSSLRFINLNKPEFTFIATGTFDCELGIGPTQNIFCKDKAPWIQLNQSIPCLDDWRDESGNSRAIVD